MFLWWPDKNHYSLAGKFWFLHHIPQTLNLQISIYFDLYKILSMEKNSVLWKTAKGTWNSSFLKKIKSFGKMELRSCLKNGRRQWNKMVNTLFSSWWKWKMCLLFLLKNQKNFWAKPIHKRQNKVLLKNKKYLHFRTTPFYLKSPTWWTVYL